MSPAQALNAGTALGAEVLGMQDRIGTLAEGKLADIIAVKLDPMESIETLEKPDFVMLGGSVIVPHDGEH
jgi:imidazolonepropionase-like amidohydrolase